ncbi:MAG TPA: hypothetical protein VD927_11105 [Chryseosolibacter sp.]|nr:hypothetical protein [Chryseosolibacter sp.]
MDEKISLEAIALYGDAYAEKILKNFFASRDQIMGKEILSLSNVQQVNMFVIREIFRSWKEEARKQKSVYFDNDHPEVKEALQNYMTVVSNHILVDQTYFAPILKKAVSQSLLVIFNPYDFFSMIITGKNNKLDVAAFREDLKYLKVNKAPLERMLEKLDEKGTTELAGNEAFAILDHILEEVNFTPEDVEGYILRFSEVVPLNAERFYIPNQNAAAQPPREKPPVKNPATTEDTSVNAQQNSNREAAVMDNITRISKIKESLSINQKFMFTKVLFYGDFDSFSRAIDDLDQLNDLPSALNYLEGHSAAWDRDSKEFHEFMELVEKRFS